MNDENGKVEVRVYAAGIVAESPQPRHAE